MTPSAHTRRTGALSLAALALVLAATGCASSGYRITTSPTRDTRSFQHIEVGEITAAATEDTLAAATPVLFRNAITAAIEKEDLYQTVSSGATAADGVLVIGCRITEFVRGSQAGRWLTGGLAGKGKIALDCSFTDRATNGLVAEGTFSKTIKGGWFGGTVKEESLAKDMGKEIAKFLERNG